MKATDLVFKAAALLVSGFLSGCITTSTNPAPAPSSDEEIAALNMQLGVSYLRQGDFDVARGKLEKAVELDPGSAVAHRALALVYERLGDFPGAERHYLQAYKLAPRDPDVLNGLAVFLCLRNNDVDEALKYLDQAIAVPVSQQVSDKTMLNVNAGVCAKREDLRRAEGYFRAALAHDPRSSEVLLQLADVSFQSNKGLPARAFLERYFALPANSAMALWLGVQIEQQMGDTMQVRKYGERLKQEFPTSAETSLLLEMESDAGSS